MNIVNGHRISISEKNSDTRQRQLFFINLGGYKPNEFDEFHYKMLVVSETSAQAIRASKDSAFFKHTGFEGATSHVDDKYGVDVDDIFNIGDILSEQYRNLYSLQISKADGLEDDPMHLGYLSWENIR